MKFDFPKIVRSFTVSEYAPEFKGEVQVWVNPPVKVLTTVADTHRRYMESKGQDGLDEHLTVLSELLSQGSEETHLSVGELKELIETISDTDPLFWLWMQARVLKEINDHRLQLKKV